MHPHRILLVVTSADRMGSAPEPTGVWLEEVAAPYYHFLDAQCEITIASPLGGKTPIDPTSAQEEHLTTATRRFEADIKAQHALDHTLKLATMDAANYDAVFFAGGHGTMEDFPTDPSVKAMVEAFYRAGKPVASVCHGPACLVHAAQADGTPIIAGHHFTCFSDAEERTIGAEERVPFLLESALTKKGGIARIGAPFAAHIIVDRQLITGQNPASSIPTADAVLQLLHQSVAA